MIKKTILSFICLLFGFLAYSQITDTVKPLSKPGEKYYFGKHIAFPCDIYIGGFWQSTSSMVSDTALYRVFDIIKYTDKKYVDSMRKAKPKAHFFQFRFPNKILLGVKLDPKLSNYVSDSFTSDIQLSEIIGGCLYRSVRKFYSDASGVESQISFRALNDSLCLFTEYQP